MRVDVCWCNHWCHPAVQGQPKRQFRALQSWEFIVRLGVVDYSVLLSVWEVPEDLGYLENRPASHGFLLVTLWGYPVDWKTWRWLMLGWWAGPWPHQGLHQRGPALANEDLTPCILVPGTSERSRGHRITNHRPVKCARRIARRNMIIEYSPYIYIYTDKI